MSAADASRSERIVRLLGWAIALAILAIVAGFAYVVASGVLQPHSPRTAMENATQSLEQDLKVDPGNPETWAEYISVLTYAERYSEATTAVEDAFESVDASMTVPIEVAELELLFVQGEYDAVLDMSDGVLKSIEAGVVFEKETLKNKDVGPSAIADLSIGATERISVHVVRAKVYRAREQWELVIVEADKALAEDPLAADILTLRGIAHAALGDEAAARADLEKALEFGHEPARVELDKLEG